MDSTTFAVQFLKLDDVHNLNELKNLVEETDEDILVKFMVENLSSHNIAILWHKMLVGLSNSSTLVEKRFKIVLAVLDNMRTVEKNMATSADLVLRLYQDLKSFPHGQLVQLSDFCLDSMRAGDPKWCGWKDLFPPIISILSHSSEVFNFNELDVSGSEFHNLILNSICSMKWEKTILSAATNMFREIELNKDEKAIIIAKIHKVMLTVDPKTLASLAPELFSFCSSDTLIYLSLFVFDKYFYLNMYKKLFAENTIDSSSFDMIEQYSEKEFKEAENTILFHLNSYSQFKITEKQVVEYFKSLEYTPNYILTPFMINALLAISRTPEKFGDLRLSSSHIYPFLRNVISSYYYDNELGRESSWCRGHLETMKTVNLKKLFSILIANSESSANSTTPRLVYLSLTLLKAKKMKTLHKLGIYLLQEIVKKHSMYVAGVVKLISDFIFADQEALQYSECLTLLCRKHPRDALYGKQNITKIIDNFLHINGKHAMRVMNFVFPLIKMCDKTRNYFTEMLRQALTSKEMWTRKMGIYGCCMILKHSKDNMAKGANVSSGSMTQIMSSFSCYSMQTLATQSLTSSTGSIITNFDVMTLEILGVLRKCLTESLEIKELMYENLTRAAECKPGLITHFLKFIERHLKSYFIIDELSIEIKFYLIVGKEGTINSKPVDNLGKLLAFVCACIVQREKVEYSNANFALTKFIETLLQRINSLTLEQLGIIGTLDIRTSAIGMQYLNCLEALMEYAVHLATPENQYLQNLSSLFVHYRDCMEELQKKATTKKSGVRKNANITNATIITQNSQNSASANVVFKPENIWNLGTVQTFLTLIHSSKFKNLLPAQTHSLRTNREFGRYVLGVATIKIESLRKQSDYCLTKHSDRLFRYLCECTNIVYTKCIVRIEELCGSFDVETAHLCIEYFKQALITAENVYEDRLDSFLKVTVGDSSKEKPILAIIKTIQQLITNTVNDNSIVGISATNSEKNKLKLFECLEILYKHLDEDELDEAFNWDYEFCLSNKYITKNLGIVHSNLFRMRYRTHSDKFFQCVAKQIVNIYGVREENVEFTPEFTLLSLTDETVDHGFVTLCAIMRRQVHDIEHFIQKAGSQQMKVKIFKENEKSEDAETLFALETSISSELISIMYTLEVSANANFSTRTTLLALCTILKETYVCLANFIKYFIKRHNTFVVSKSDASLDKLVKASKKMAKPVYGLMTLICQDKPSEETGKGVRNKGNSNINNMKPLAMLTFDIENFNKFVMSLSDKTRTNLSSYLHPGLQRDFQIRTSDFNNFEKGIMPNNNETQNDEDDEDDENRCTNTPATISPDVLEEPSGSFITNQFLRNLEKLNKKAAKKKKLDATNNEDDEVSPPKRRSTRRSRQSVK